VFFSNLDLLDVLHRREVQLVDARGLAGVPGEAFEVAKLAMGDEIDGLLHARSFDIDGARTHREGCLPDGPKSWAEVIA